ncbi:glycosyltransferase family 61 protein [Francisella philomiragia]|uniref:glycosyltransferase family 61 protein n=1 Tax=Francisella philomiragia TaxID=28110 RepID=UPI00190568FD|nr:glycosyltransferase family 61 protein [Francisella philomiragia]MBK2267753.1 glycosyltransferase family 61 protein [Francisella philomiragia]MBK2279149.1 glycosyltransferase family 61 protein [Francisella philomiragia]MBK2287062.1 glycosyltransferase family 61 protein [Francisella philomiragia]MBK2288981.1 glycosyltransferase family 61 protein [Francisella philomiragia]MBK2290699.1 glycosyltransferase family 61 protein [Francisella philomiragia]
MILKDIARVMYMFVPRFMREQFVNDVILAIRRIREPDQSDYIEDVERKYSKKLMLVKDLDLLGCEYNILYECKDRSIQLSAPKLIIDGEKYFKNEINTELPDTAVYFVNDVTLIGGSDSLINQGNVYNHDLNSMSNHHEIKRFENIEYHGGGFYKFYLDSEEIKSSGDKTYISLISEYSWNYYHWIVEVLPKFMMILDVLKKQDEKFDCTKYTLLVDQGLPSQCIDILNIVAGCSFEIEAIELRRLLFCKKVIFAKPLSYVLENNKNPVNNMKDVVIDIDALKDLKRKVLNNVSIKPFKAFSSKKIYLQRDNKVRTIENINELERLLHKKGFEFVNPIGLSFCEQLSMFQHAEVIIAPSGAAFTNMLFMRGGTKAINLYPSVTGVNFNIFEPIAAASGVELVHFLTNPVSDTSYIHGNVTVNVQDLEKYLDDILA